MGCRAPAEYTARPGRLSPDRCAHAGPGRASRRGESEPAGMEVPSRGGGQPLTVNGAVAVRMLDSPEAITMNCRVANTA